MKKKKLWMRGLAFAMAFSLVLSGNVTSISAAEIQQAGTEQIETQSAETQTQFAETQSVETNGEVTTGGEEITEEANAGADSIDTEIIAETEESVEASSDIASGVDGKLTWIIDANGKLTINGVGDLGTDNDYGDWLEYASEIKSADVNVTRTTDMSWWFKDCTNLQNIDFTDSNTSYVSNMDAMFYGCSNLQTLDLSNFDTSNVRYLADMFHGCSNLQTLNLSNFDTSNVIYMSCMFYGCSNLQTLDLGSFDTSQIIFMQYMFYDCTELSTSITVSGSEWYGIQGYARCFFNAATADNAKITVKYAGDCTKEMAEALAATGSTESHISVEEDWRLPVSGTDGDLSWSIDENGKLTVSGEGNCDGNPDWLEHADVIKTADINASGMTNMEGWFNGCSVLISVDFTDTDTSLVTDMSSLFSSCGSLETLDLNMFDTSNVIDMHSMFSDCYSMRNLQISNFNTSKVQNMAEMFLECNRLENLNVNGFDTSNVTNMDSMFAFCARIEELDVSHFDTSNVTDMRGMFCECCSLKNLDVSGFDTSNVTEESRNDYSGFEGMFSGCSSLEAIDASHFNTSGAKNLSGMFQACSSVTSINVSSFNTSQVENFSSMFQGCSNLMTLDLSNFETSEAEEMEYMFAECTNLTQLEISSFTFDKAAYINDMFYFCENLRTSFTFSRSIPEDGNLVYGQLFLNAATADNARIILKYSGSCTYDMAKTLVNTKSDDSHVYLFDEHIDPPADFSVSTSGECNTITFTGSENAAGYEIYRAEEENGEYTLIATITDPAASSYEDYESNEINTAYYKMLAYTVNGNNETFYSDFTEPAGVIGTGPNLLTQPTSQRVLVGDKFTFSVEADGQELTYLWQYSKDGGETWIDTTRTKDNYGTTATKGMNGRMFRCVITAAKGHSVTSDYAVLTVCTTENYEVYVATDGSCYTTWDEVPCETTYTHYYLDEEGNKNTAVETKSHSYVQEYYDRDGNEVDPDTDLPCGQYMKYSACQNCGDRTLLGAETVEHVSNGSYTYVTADGTVYEEFSDIPYFVHVNSYTTCDRCGTIMPWESFMVTDPDAECTTLYVTEDGTEYQNIQDIPCGSAYSYVDRYSVSGEGEVEETHSGYYKTHSYSMKYYTQDGTEYEDPDSLPCGTYVTEKGTCSVCGDEYEDGYYVEHEYVTRKWFPDKKTMLDGETEFDGDIPCQMDYLMIYTCRNCGDTYTRRVTKEHEFTLNVTLTGEDGTVYSREDEIPCGTRYTKSADCYVCGEHMEESLVREHSFEAINGTNYSHNSYLLTGQDGSKYRAAYIYGLQIYGYTSADGNGSTLWMYPACKTLTEEGICAICGEKFSRTFETHEWLEQEDGTYACANCGLVKDDCDFYKNAAEITAQPEATAVVVGEKFTFQVQATGECLTYLWQYSTDNGKTWTDTTRTKDNYGTTAKTAMDGRLFRCLITDANGNTLTSDSALLTVKPLIEITSQPEAATVNVGDLYRFKVTAVSNIGSTLTYLWQYSKNKTTWTDTTRTLNNYGTYATYGMDGRYFRCQITDADGNVTYSDPVLLRVQGEITITEQPADQTVAAGDKFIFQVTATGASLTYLWQYSTDGGSTWTDTTRTKNNYTTYAKKAMNGRMYRCVITDSSNNSVTSEPGTLTVN